MVYLTLQEALDFLEELCSDDENDVSTNIQALYIEPPYQDGDVSGEDDGEDEGGVPDNVCPAQFKAGCEMVFENSTRMKTTDCNIEDVDDEEPYDDTLDDCLPSSSKVCRPIQSNTGVPLPPANKDSKYTWQTANSLPVLPKFPETNSEDCRHLRPHQLFEKFFSDDLLEHICKCSNIVLIVTGYTSTGAFRDMWSCDDDVQNVMVFNAMRRNRFEEIKYMLHFESALHEPSASSDRFDTLWKLRPVGGHIKAKMTENFHPEQNLSYDESVIAYFGRYGCKQFIKERHNKTNYQSKRTYAAKTQQEYQQQQQQQYQQLQHQ
ncbi:piggyBac transposable element-derived protein 3-like [Bactrocera dorsalis]|uniref:PiggyBac transposable element-derived protein 3-like n=1 Tax=Bactrocera dorsalis TaxID=27457 RepID=A0ABM3J180_BACDO|nr:piggyBac transposable element-derived protein 3-like [Bactrocera dorsalis]